MQSSLIKTGLCLLSCGACALVGCASTQLKSPDPTVRRDALIKLSRKPGSISILRGALEDENTVVRRTAARLLTEKGVEAEDEMVALLDDRDSVIRYSVLNALSLLKGKELPLNILEKALSDSDASVRMQAMSILVSEKPIDAKRTAVIQAHIPKEKDQAIISMGSSALWPFRRDVLLLKNRPDWDHEVRVVGEIPLPTDGWLFRTDPKSSGHFPKSKWYSVQLDEKEWRPIEIARIWETDDFKYDGIAWYRRTFKTPEKPAKFNAIELHFDAVDECAWVWVNGVYVGEHNIGPGGWQSPFNLDVTNEIKWGADNQITVRVLDTTGAGGIYKPVTLQVVE